MTAAGPVGASTHGHVNQCDARPKVRVGVVGVHEGVLAPVADHEAGAHDEKRQQVDDKGGLGAKERRHGGVEGVGEELASGGPHHAGPLLSEVERQLQPDEEEAADVAEEVGRAFPLVAQCRRQVVRAVVLDVVVLDVVVVVRVPHVAHERVEDVGEQGVEGGEAPGQDAALVCMCWCIMSV